MRKCFILVLMNELQGKTPSALPTKKYPFRFSSLILVVLILGLVLCAAGFGLTTWQFLGFLRDGNIASVYEWLKYVLLYFVSVFLALVIVAMLIKSQYLITDKQLILQFGIIRSKYDLKKIYSIQHFRGSDRLTVYFDDYKSKYMVIVVKQSWYDDFVKTLTERNEKISFDFVTAEEENNLKKK